MAILETDYWTTPNEETRGIIKFLEHYGEIQWNGQYYDLDSCANLHNTKVPTNYITEKMNALQVDWNGSRVWCNPPYSRGNVKAFIDKAVEQIEKSQKDVIMLLNVDTSTKYFNTILQKAKAVVYVTGGRIRFIKTADNEVKSDPLKPSMFVLFSSIKNPNDFVRSYYCDLSFLQELGKYDNSKQS